MSSLTFVMILQTDEEQYGNKESQNLISTRLNPRQLLNLRSLQRFITDMGMLLCNLKVKGDIIRIGILICKEILVVIIVSQYNC